MMTEDWGAVYHETYCVKTPFQLVLLARGIATGGGISVYIPQNQSTLKKFMWLFFSCDPGQIRYDICSRVGH